MLIVYYRLKRSLHAASEDPPNLYQELYNSSSREREVAREVGRLEDLSCLNIRSPFQRRQSRTQECVPNALELIDR